jgi:16S rRNA (guanine1207-N2)-methyltransferase
VASLAPIVTTSERLEGVLAALRRRPDIEAAELQAYDAADRLLLDLAIDEHADSLVGNEVVVIGDNHGALTLGALSLGARHVRVHQDSLVAERALAENAAALGMNAYSNHSLVEVVSADARLIIARLPRALDALDAIARRVARDGDPDVTVLTAGMVKHMSRGMNDVLGASFGRLDVSLARRKARALIARHPLPRDAVGEPEPLRARDSHLGLEVVAVPGVFAGASVDIGARALLKALEATPRAQSPGTIIDLGCGTGIVATRLALAHPTARVIASDVSAAAVRSAQLTAAANGAEIDTIQDDALGAQPDASADLIVLNPPFHVGAAVHTGVAQRLFRDAARVLRPGGELWVVWNSHLRYTATLERIVGSTRQVSRDAKFTVTVSRRRSSPGLPAS